MSSQARKLGSSQSRHFDDEERRHAAIALRENTNTHLKTHIGDGINEATKVIGQNIDELQEQQTTHNIALGKVYLISELT